MVRDCCNRSRALFLPCALAISKLVLLRYAANLIDRCFVLRSKALVAATICLVAIALVRAALCKFAVTKVTDTRALKNNHASIRIRDCEGEQEKAESSDAQRRERCSNTFYRVQPAASCAVLSTASVLWRIGDVYALIVLRYFAQRV